MALAAVTNAVLMQFRRDIAVLRKIAAVDVVKLASTTVTSRVGHFS
jgi:hypothetical protein